MKVIAITVEVDDDVDIYAIHEQVLDQFPEWDGETGDGVIVYESVDALITDHIQGVSPR